jgi:hypothetical protein
MIGRFCLLRLTDILAGAAFLMPGVPELPFAIGMAGLMLIAAYPILI